MPTLGEIVGWFIIFGLPGGAIIFVFWLFVFGLQVGPRAWDKVVERRMENTKIVNLEPIDKGE